MASQAIEWSDGESFDGLGSDLEATSPPEFQFRHGHNDFSLGMKTLECCMMKRAYDNVDSVQNDFDLNIACANQFLQFPYQECIRSAAEAFDNKYDLNCYALGQNCSASLATLLGATYRVNLDDHAKLLAIVDSMGRTGTQGRKRFHAAEEGSGRGQTSVEETGQLPRYAMKLNEYAQAQQFRISWDETELSLDPPKFRAAMRIHGRKFEGIASSKKTARHLASKHACIALAIMRA